VRSIEGKAAFVSNSANYQHVMAVLDFKHKASAFLVSAAKGFEVSDRGTSMHALRWFYQGKTEG